MTTSRSDPPASPEGFANPWEHARLLSDRARNDGMVACLARLAPGRTVLEIGCGTGLLSCVAARLGARRVLAVEPSPLVEVARELVAVNGLGQVVEVLEGRLQDLEPREVDLAVSELLNADPFYEDVVEISRVARSWLAPGGILAPRRLVVKVALLAAPDSAREVATARAEVARLGAAHGLAVEVLEDLLGASESYRYVSQVDPAHLLTAGAVAWDVPLGSPRDLDEELTLDLPVLHPGPAGAAVVWFEAELTDGVELANRPGEPSHWGQLVCAFSEERPLRRGERVRLELEVDDGEIDVRWG